MSSLSKIPVGLLSVCVLLLIQVVARSHASKATLQLLAPKQWAAEFEEFKVEWTVNGFPDLPASDHSVIVIINGHVAHTSQSLKDSVLFGDMQHGSYYVQVMLAKYDEVEGIDDVHATVMVECFFGVTPPPPRPVTTVNGAFTPYAAASVLPDKSDQRKVVIFSFHCNRPDFVRLQAEALRRFILDEFTLVVVNDAPSDELREEIASVSKRVGAEHVVTPDYFDHSDPSEVVGRIVTWAVQDVALKHYDNSLLILLEGDMFPVAPFSVASFLHHHDIAGTQQGRRHRSSGFLLRYLWVGLLFVDLEDLPNKTLLRFERELIGDVGGDTAAALHHFFDATPQARVRRVLHTSHIHSEFSNRHALPPEAQERYQDPFRMELYERTFLHYGSASNWKIGRQFEYFNSAQDFLPAKTEFLFWMVRATMAGNVTIPAYDFVYEQGTWTLPTGPVTASVAESEGHPEL